MTANRSQMLSGMTTRQKVTAVLFILIVLFLLYQIYGLFGSSSPPPPAPLSQDASRMSAAGPGAVPPQGPIPQSIETSKPTTPVLSEREAELLRMQQESEARYISALNELQMLKISRDIAETNKAIMAAKLETLTAEKNIVDLLKPPPPVTQANYAQGLVAPLAQGMAVTGQGALPTITPAQPAPLPGEPAPVTQPAEEAPPSAAVTPPPAPNANYTVISVSQLHSRWSAVLGLSGRLWSVYVGDIIPADQSKVISIDKSGVVLERNGVKRKVSLVPLI